MWFSWHLIMKSSLKFVISPSGSRSRQCWLGPVSICLIKWSSQVRAIFSSAYPVGEIAINSAPVRLSFIQSSKIFSPGQIITGGRRGLLSAQIVSIIVRDWRFSGLAVYSSFTSVGTITISPVGHPILTADSSRLNISFPCLMSYFVRILWYSRKKLFKSFLLWVAIRVWAIGFVLIVCRRGFFFNHWWNQVSDVGLRFFFWRRWQIAANIMDSEAPSPISNFSWQNQRTASSWAAVRITLLPPCRLKVLPQHSVADGTYAAAAS